MNQEPPDVLGDLLDEARLVVEGDYIGTIRTIEGPFSPKMSGRSYQYFKVKITLDSTDNEVSVFVFLAAWPPVVHFLKVSLPNFAGEKVKVGVKHREFDDRLYLDAKIMEWKI